MESNKKPLITPPNKAKLDLSESQNPPNSMSIGRPNKKIQQQGFKNNDDDDDDDDDDGDCCCCFPCCFCFACC